MKELVFQLTTFSILFALIASTQAQGNYTTSTRSISPNNNPLFKLINFLREQYTKQLKISFWRMNWS